MDGALYNRFSTKPTSPNLLTLTATPVRRRAVGLRGLVRGGIRVAVLIVVPVLEIVVVLSIEALMSL